MTNGIEETGIVVDGGFCELNAYIYILYSKSFEEIVQIFVFAEDCIDRKLARDALFHCITETTAQQGKY